jgi:hypothetical protein
MFGSSRYFVANKKIDHRDFFQILFCWKFDHIVWVTPKKENNKKITLFHVFNTNPLRIINTIAAGGEK